MISYPVVLQKPGIPDPPVAGRLQVTAQGVTFHGGAAQAERRIEIPACDITGARRTSTRVGMLPTVALDTRSLGTILIAALGAGAGTAGEILASLQQLAAAVA
jgi:hypothetical protein